MIVKKTWERPGRDKLAPGKSGYGKWYVDTYTGWFLFGLIPLYVVRSRVG